MTEEIPAGAIYILSNYEGLDGEKNGRYYPKQLKADRKGVLTIGRGHVLTPVEMKTGIIRIAGVDYKHKDGITLEQVDALYEQDKRPRWEAVKKLFPKALSHELGAALIVYYNTPSALISGSVGRYMKAGLRVDAAGACLLYVNSNGKPQLGLWRRQLAVAHYMLTGVAKLATTPQTQEELEKTLKASGVLLAASKIAKAQKIVVPFLVKALA